MGNVASRVIEYLNRAARRIRYPGEDDDWASALLDAVLVIAKLAALFRIDGNMLRLERVRGIEEDDLSAVSLEVPLVSAPAFQTVVASRDSVVALPLASEISEPVVRGLSLDMDGRIALIPLVVRQKVTAVLLAAGGELPASLDGLELIATLAGAVLEGRTDFSDRPSADLVSIRGISA